MEVSEYKNIFNNENKHFFYKANHNLILNLVDKYVYGSGLAILDAGCGTGLLSKRLSRFGKVVGLDASDEALAFAKARGVTLKKGSVENLPFKDGSFNLVVSVDVIYHNSIKSDLSAIKEFFRVLKPEGILIMRVPANKWLSLAHDRHVHTRERYQLGELNKKVLKAGFEIRRSSYINMVLLPIAIVKHFVEKLSWSNGNAKS